MGKKQRKTANHSALPNSIHFKGSEGFDAYYQQIYGDRWPTLKNALKQEKTHFAWETPAGNYYLDPASILVARSLGVKPGMKVLDMCAAPGGKALVLTSAMQGQGELFLNELSRDRRHRLGRVIEEHSAYLQNIIFTGIDGRKWCLGENKDFDRILLDAPCSSERHVLESETHLSQWSFSRTKRLSMDQFALLSSAMESLRVCGELVYATCALSPLENDGVVEKFKQRWGDKIEVLDISLDASLTADLKLTADCIGEKTQWGWQVNPDKEPGLGPLYWAKLRKLADRE